ncbi:iron ABC transporter permease [Kiritimatiellaeota bacterium B1221]|nr:iron ABC transporter permease [Kiritimatiellaeota bacterium B1221]
MRGLWILGVLLVLTSALSLCLGGSRTGPAEILEWMQHRLPVEDAAYVEMVMTTIRFPRTLGAIVVGSALGLAGALLQTVTRNILAETDILGINGGAALGVVIGISYFSAETMLSWQLFAISGALLGTTLVMWTASRGRGGLQPLRLVLAGLAIASTFQGLIGYILLQQQNSLDQYRFWVLGSLSGLSTAAVLSILPACLLAFGLSAWLYRGLHALQLGDDVASSLGHRPGLLRLLAVGAVTLLTGCSIALTGPVVLLGLAAPYFARGFSKGDMARFLIYSALSGAVILLAADLLARTVIAPYETPLSVIVVFLGTPILIRLARSSDFTGEASA